MAARSSEGAGVPPPGPPLSFREWTRAVYRHVREQLPDVVARGMEGSVILTRGQDTVRIESGGDVRWVHFDRAGKFAMPPLSVSRHDAFTVGTVAKTILGFFESRLST